MITEGLLKGDSALTAYLRAHGASWEELRDASDGAQTRLTALLQRIPPADRVLIVSIAGIYNTTQNPVDWRHIKLRGREVWIAFDADLDTNKFVWRAASKLWSELIDREKVDRVRLISPKMPSDSGIEKAGVDDFLAQAGTWSDLLLQSQVSLPEAPETQSDTWPGEFRVTADGNSTEVCVAVSGGPNGEVSDYRWVQKFPYGGRILATEIRRNPTDEEMRTGEFDSSTKGGTHNDARATLEITWIDAHQVQRAVLIEGSDEILVDLPADWKRSLDVVVPPSLKIIGQWPPRGKDAERWLSTIKDNRQDEIQEQVRWGRMGWVPVPESHPVFVLADQVVGDTNGISVLGGASSKLEVAESYGVGERLPSGNFHDTAYQSEVVRILSIVLDAYVLRQPFTDRYAAAVVLAAGLRPVLPLRPGTTIFFYGPKGKGKSYAAQRMMAFWAKHRSDWVNKLPGSAKDTVAFIEFAISLTPIWVVDDLAPSVLKSQAVLEESKLSDLVRNIFNNVSKGRMKPGMSSQAQNEPMAQLVITAEFPLTVPSARERTIPVFMGPGKLHPSEEPTDYLTSIARDHAIPAQLTGHLINFVIHRIVETPGGWATFLEDQKAHKEATIKLVQKTMKARGAPGGSLKRVSELAADQVVVFDLLHDMATLIGADKKTLELLSHKGLVSDLVDGILAAHHENQELSPGKSILYALKSLMGSGKAHVINSDDPTHTPIHGEMNTDPLTNPALGWVANSGTEGGLRPSGPSIGKVVLHPIHGYLIFFEVRAAFKAAQEAYPDLIPFGQHPTVIWNSVWDENLTPSGVTRPKDSKTGSSLSTYKYRGVSGVPIAVKTLTGFGEDTDEDDAVDGDPTEGNDTLQPQSQLSGPDLNGVVESAPTDTGSVEVSDPNAPIAGSMWEMDPF